MESNGQKGSYSRRERFFYLIFLPVLFGIILAAVLLGMINEPFRNWALALGNRIPLVEKAIPDPPGGAAEKERSPQQLMEEKVKEYESALAQKNAEIDSLKKEIAAKEEQIAQLNDQLLKTEAKQQGELASREEREKQIRSLAKLYSAMNPSKAAAIIANLGVNEAVLVLSQMDESAKAGILEKMDPEKASDLSILLKDRTYSAELDIKALQERIAELTAELDKARQTQDRRLADSRLDDAVQSLEKMDPAAAARILGEMWQSGKKAEAVDILEVMEPALRSAVLAKMNPQIAAQIAAGMIGQ